jgi:hypothetical protein
MKESTEVVKYIHGRSFSRFYLLLFFMVFLQLPLFSQVTTNYEAKDQLREWGVYSSKIIENAETITIESGQIKASGGISVSLPILDFIYENQIILLTGASGYKTAKGTIIIEADLLYISAVVINVNGKKYLVVGQSLRDIVNYLLK